MKISFEKCSWAIERRNQVPNQRNPSMGFGTRNQCTRLNGFSLKITPLESQIPYKLLLGSQKDFEDAEHLWLVTKRHLDNKTLNSFIRQLKVEKEAAKWLQ